MSLLYDSVSKETEDTYVQCFLDKVQTIERLRDECLAAVKDGGHQVDTERRLLKDVWLNTLLFDARRHTYSESQKPHPGLVVHRLLTSVREVLNELERLYGDVLVVIGDDNQLRREQYRVTIAPQLEKLTECPAPSEIASLHGQYREHVNQLLKRRKLAPHEDILHDFLWLKDGDSKGFFRRHHLALEKAIELKNMLEKADISLAKYEHGRIFSRTLTRRFLVMLALALIGLGINYCRGQ